MLARKTWLIRVSFIVNVALLLYLAVFRDAGSTPVGTTMRGAESAVAGGGVEIKQTGRMLANYLLEKFNVAGEQKVTNAAEVEQQTKPLAEPLQLTEDKSDLTADLSRQLEDCQTALGSMKDKSRSSSWPPTTVSPLSFGSDIENMITDEASNFDNSNNEELQIKLKSLLKCNNRDYITRTEQRGDFWVLRNYIKAGHGPLGCTDSITYTTHADYTFLDNVIPLLERWRGPLSIALHAPGSDFAPTLDTIRYLRDCAQGSELVREYVTFHIYFGSKHMPKQLPKPSAALSDGHSYNCSLHAPYVHANSSALYKSKHKLLYPVNVGRNIAREAALTHFILASDVELYPSPDVIRKFLEMIARNEGPLLRKNRRVFPMSIFEVNEGQKIPKDKTTLKRMLRKGLAIPFHKRLCPSCHKVPKAEQWVKANETEGLGVFTVGKRIGQFINWEPIYIGTHDDPLYDERLSWEGKKDKMTQGYALCVLDYDFLILDNAFLVHKPGIKIYKIDPKRQVLSTKTNKLIKLIIFPELKVLYGVRKGCAV